MRRVHLIPLSLRAAYLAMHRRTNECLAVLDITADQFVCLLSLHKQEGIIQRELVTLVSSDPNTIRAMLVILERKKLVTRERSPLDRRAQIVRLTPSGVSKTEAALRQLRTVQGKLHRAFSTSEREALQTSLLKLSTALG